MRTLSFIIAIAAFGQVLTAAGEDAAAGIRSLLRSHEEWRWITLTAEAGLPPGRVQTMETDGDGVVWVGTERGLAWFDEYQFVQPAPTAGEAPRDVRRIARLGSGEVAVLADKRLWIARQGRLRPESAPADVLTVAPLAGGALYVMTVAGDYIWSEGRWTLLAHTRNSYTVLPGHKGIPWRQTLNSGLYRWNGTGWGGSPHFQLGDQLELAAEADGLLVVAVRSPGEMTGLWEAPVDRPGNPVRVSLDTARTLALLPSGEGVASFDSGDVRVRLDGRWRSLENSFSGAVLRRATSLLLRGEEIWVGTLGGVNVYRSQAALRQRSFSPGDGRNNIHEIVRRRNGELWMATTDGLLLQSPDGEWRTIREIEGRRIGVMTGLAEDAAGDLWVSSGSSFGGAFRLREGVWRHFGAVDGLTDWPVHRIRADRGGRLWFLTNFARTRGRESECGAYRWDGGRFAFFGRAPNIPDMAVTSAAQAPDGAMWFGTAAGLVRSAGDRWEQHIRELRFDRVFDVAAGPDGAIWFCHQRGGGGVGRLVRSENGAAQVTYFTTLDGLPSNEVWAVYAEADGRVWVSTANGVGVYQGGPWVPAGIGFGIDGIKTWPLLLEEDNLWFGTLGQGVLRLSRQERRRVEPRVFFQPAALAGDRWRLGWRALAHGGAIRPGDILTRYRVDGRAWSAWSTVREHVFPEADFGSHRVEVQVVDALGNVAARPAVSELEIPAPFYRRPLFAYAACFALLALGSLVAQFVRNRLRYTRELEIARRRAVEGGNARSAFLAVMSHEIRTPMNGVLGMTTLLADTALDPRQRGYVETIRNSAEALLSVINDVLDFSKIESGTFSIQSSPFDLEEVCEQVVTLLASRAGEKALPVAVDYPEALPAVVSGDAGRVRQILLNLAGNAIKFTDAGSVRIAVSAVPAGLRIAVIDTGIGIPADKIPQLFREFSQIDSADNRRHGGTGLGLAISRKLAERMGGTLTVESAPGSGSRFLCDLPLSPVVVAPRPALDGRCLVVHPSALVRATLAGFCGDLGLRAETAASPGELPGGPFDWVFTAGRWCLEVEARLGPAGTRVIAIDTPRAGAPDALLPLSRRGLRTLIAEAGSRERTAPSSAPELFRGRVLVVEDNLTNQRVTRLLLEKLGCEVVVAGDGLQALQLLAHQEFDLVFMDVQMPVMDGLEATRRLRAIHPAGRAVPVLALTANAMEEDRQRCFEAGMSGYLSKPVARDEMISAIRRYLPVRSVDPVDRA